MSDVTSNKLTIGIAPHIHTGFSTQFVMLLVILSLIPAMGVSLYAYGLSAMKLYTVCVVSCLAFETLSNILLKRENTIFDLTAVITGILLAMNLPASAPIWLAIVGSFAAICIAKMVFGGLGANPFNPALVGRVFLLISFPVQMTAWVNPVDGESGATLLGASKTYIQLHDGTLIGFEVPDAVGSLFGLMGGSLGEASVVALLIGGIFLIFASVIKWEIPVTFIGTVFILTFVHNLVYPETTLPAVMHIMSGGLVLGAFFMATDYSTSPFTKTGRIIFGVGCGVLTVVIRMYGGYPEGVAFAILIMNATTPLLDKFIKPRIYGEVKS